MDRYEFDQDYIDRLKAGEAETQRHFVRYFSDLLSIKLRSRLRSPHLIEEARQETFLRVLAALHRNALDRADRLGAFLNSVCNNVVFEYYRSENRTPNLPEDAPEPLDERPNQEAGYEAVERRELVSRVLEDLPAKDRELLRQVFLEERDKDEVCREFGIDREYLRVMLHRARGRFRAALEEQRANPVR